MVVLVLAEEQLWRLFRVRVAQNRNTPCKEEPVHDHADRNQHAN